MNDDTHNALEQVWLPAKGKTKMTTVVTCINFQRS